MTAVVEKTETTPAAEQEAPADLAGWGSRAAAFAIDVVPGVAVIATMALASLSAPLRSALWSVSVSVLATVIMLTLINRLVWPANRGWSLGRAVMGIVVVGPDGSPAGLGRLLWREVAHLLDTLSMFVGWLWPLWDSRRRTFADLLLRTEVRRVERDQRPANVRRLSVIVVTIAVLLCLGGAAGSVAVVFMNDWHSDQTRAAIQTQGPKIVTEMLSYDPKSLHDEFARAQSLTTDRYRPKLVEQQQSAQKRRPIVNEYWATDSAVLSATPDQASMLIFLQGHRGDGNEQRPITATVRVSFVKGTGGQWLVDDLAVVTKPKIAVGEK